MITASVWIFWAIKIHDRETWAPRTLLMSNSKCIVFILFSIGCIHLSDPSDPHNVCKHLYETTNGNKTWVIFLNLCLSVLCVQKPFLAKLKRFSECIEVEMAYWSRGSGRHFGTLCPEDTGRHKWINSVFTSDKKELGKYPIYLQNSQSNAGSSISWHISTLCTSSPNDSNKFEMTR